MEIKLLIPLQIFTMSLRSLYRSGAFIGLSEDIAFLFFFNSSPFIFYPILKKLLAFSYSTAASKAFIIQNNREGFDGLFQRIKSVASDLGIIKVGLEDTGHYSYNLLRFILDKDLTTFVINPLHITNNN